MSQPDEQGHTPVADESDSQVIPTRTGGWTPARPKSVSPPPAPDRSVGPAQWAPQLPPTVAPTATSPARPVTTADPVDTSPADTATVDTAPVETAPVDIAPVDSDPTDDDPDRLRPDELPWGVPARALVGDGGQLPPPTVVARRRSPAAVAGLIALAVVVVVVVVLAIAVTR